MQIGNRRSAIGCLALTLATTSFSQTGAAMQAVMRTTLGDIEIELLQQEAPATVANFLNYVNDGDYLNSFVHRSAPGFVIQGGGFTFVDAPPPVRIPVDDPVANEFDPSRSNVRGTLAMAKLGDDPDSATSQWFINLADNSANLDTQNGGFTVFARVLGDGMAVADAIAALPIWNAGAPFDNLPLIDYSLDDGSVAARHLVFVEVFPDSDGDCLYDDEDPNPNQVDDDIDGDQLAACVDDDDDNDGIPDEVEEQYGLDKDDAADAGMDLGQDGYGNLAEYRLGTAIEDPRSNPGIIVMNIINSILLDE